MKQNSVILFLISFLSFVPLWAQNEKFDLFGIGFYNMENLFDTIHDAGKNDYEYLPHGINKWGTKKYFNKLKNMSQVLAHLGTDVTAQGVAVVGVCEVENPRVLRDLVNQNALKKRNWQIIHVEGPDLRGIDCALLYNPELFEPYSHKLVPYYRADGDTTYKTRGFLVVSGLMAGEVVHIIVNHWPARFADSSLRERAGELVKLLSDSLINENPSSKIIIMGDLNDDPDDKSVKISLGAKRHVAQVTTNELFNPWWDVLRQQGRGTIVYNNSWNLFDQIILNGNLLGNNYSSLKLYKYEIFSRDYLINREGRNSGYPKRTNTSTLKNKGYSDHLPVIVYLKKEKK